MKSHAKASSAGSNSGEGEGRGSSRRPGTPLSFVLALLVAACLVPASAFAVETRLPVESFGPDGSGGSEKFELAAALAFDQGNEHLFALDRSSGTIHGFDASTPGTHTPLGGNFPLAAEAGEYLDLAADGSSNNFYFLSLEAGSLSGFDATGTPLGGGFPIGGLSFPCGATVDAGGNIWIAELGAKAISEYDSSGTLVDSVDVSAHGFPCRVALDSESNLYVSVIEGEGGVWKYDVAGDYAEASKVDPVVSNSPVPIAVDRASDDLYVVHSDHVAVYDEDGAFRYEFGGDVAGASYAGIAIDEASDRAYLSDARDFGNGTVRVFGPPALLPGVLTEDADAIADTAATLHGKVNPEGEALTDCHFDFVPASQYEVDQYQSVTPAQQAPCVPAAASIPADSTSHAVEADVSGLEPGTTYHMRLVAANAEGTANGSDRTFLTAIGPPAISAQSVEVVGTSDVTLSAKVNPKGAKTTYRVEYGTTSAYGQSTSVSAPIGFEGDGSDHAVSVHIGGLAPGTAYHFQFVATSAAGEDEGGDTSFATYPSSASFDPCSNDLFRTGFGSRLPDCRAYEQATPIDKHGANIQGRPTLIQASGAGDRITFYLNGGLPTTGGSSLLSAQMASRGAAGWSSDGLSPLTDPGFTAAVFGWSDDLSTAVVQAPGPGNVGNALYLRDSNSAALQLGATGLGTNRSALAGFAADTSHLIFEATAALLPGATPFESNLYELDHGTLTLPGRIPSGSATSCDDTGGGPACIPAPEGAFAGPYEWLFANTAEGGAIRNYYTQNTISRDGSRVFFTTRNAGQLYVREDGTRTTHISASQRTVPDPNGEKPAAFVGATPDGSKVFFASCEKLTDDSTAFSDGAHACTEHSNSENFQGQDLYSYDVETGELTDLTVDSDASDPKGAEVLGFVGASEDGSYVYFVANGVLADDPGASPGNCLILSGVGNVSCNLYVSHGGTTTFIASLSGEIDAFDWLPGYGTSENGEPKTSRVSADGRALLFSSVRSLTGYDNLGATAGTCGNLGPAGQPCAELFRYRAPDDELACVSCNPTGLPPRGNAVLGSRRSFLAQPPLFTFLTRNLSADGNRVFFDSRDALLATDTNGVTDVYEWEAEGSGSCESDSQNGGCLYLLSSGTSPAPSYFGDASTDGGHAFLFTAQQLVPGDRDELVDIYDAGVGAGLAAQHGLAPPTCAGVACQANPPPPPEQGMSSATFSGPGNVQRKPAARKCPKGKRKVRRAGKVRCQKTSKQSKRHTNRGGSK